MLIPAILGIGLIFIILLDAFETVVFPRRVTRRFRLARLFYRTTWWLYTGMVRTLSSKKRQETYLSYYGPLSLPILLAFWAGVLIIGFSLLYWSPSDSIKKAEGIADFASCLYFSGTTFFTLGLGDIIPRTTAMRTLVVLESGMGFGFLAIIISYLPALNQSFSRREVSISLLDARAGSPPTAAEILQRHSEDHVMAAMTQLLHEWELWSAELLESHLSFPVLVYFRSQHDNQSWLAALTAILDTCVYVITHTKGATVARQAQLTFAMARHAVVDLALVLHTPPEPPPHDRLSNEDANALRVLLSSSEMSPKTGMISEERLAELRKTYEPYVYALSVRLRLSLPPWIATSSKPDNWQISEWGESSGFRRTRRPGQHDSKHF